MKTFYYTVDNSEENNKFVYVYNIVNNKPVLLEEIETDSYNCSEDVARNFLKDELSLNGEKFLLIQL